MTAPERIWASPSVDGFLDAVDDFDASSSDMAPYVRADLYDAAVAERDAARAEVERLDAERAGLARDVYELRMLVERMSGYLP